MGIRAGGAVFPWIDDAMSHINEHEIKKGDICKEHTDITKHPMEDSDVRCGRQVYYAGGVNGRNVRIL